MGKTPRNDSWIMEEVTAILAAGSIHRQSAIVRVLARAYDRGRIESQSSPGPTADALRAQERNEIIEWLEAMDECGDEITLKQGVLWLKQQQDIAFKSRRPPRAPQTGEPAAPPKIGPDEWCKAYCDHLDRCKKCFENPFDLCPVGHALLTGTRPEEKS